MTLVALATTIVELQHTAVLHFLHSCLIIQYSHVEIFLA